MIPVVIWVCLLGLLYYLLALDYFFSLDLVLFVMFCSFCIGWFGLLHLLFTFDLNVVVLFHCVCVC